MKIEWSDRFKQSCKRIDRATGWTSSLGIAEDCVEFADEIVLDIIDTDGAYDFEVNDGGFDLEDIYATALNFKIWKEYILNWDDYYAYRKTMFMLEAV